MNATEARANLEGGAAPGAARLSERATEGTGQPREATDAIRELMSGTRRGAFLRIVRHYSAVCYIEADDLAQETLLTVWTGFHRFRPDSWEFTSWVGWMAKSVAAEIVRLRNTLKRRGTTHSIDVMCGDGAEFHCPDARATDPVEVACDSERREFVVRTVRPVFDRIAARMKGTKLLVLRRRLLSEHPTPYTELAAEAGVKEGAINGRMCALKKELSEDEGLRELAAKLLTM